MQHNEVLLICDWSMKHLPRKNREDQSDWLGERARGLPWHITMTFHKRETCIESPGFVHIFQSQVSQDSITTAAIIINVLENIQSIDASISSFHVWSDNAGCYKSTEMMTLLKSILIDILIETITSVIIASRQMLCRAQKCEMKTKRKEYILNNVAGVQRLSLPNALYYMLS